MRDLVSSAARLLRGSDDGNPRLGFNIESRCVVTSALHLFAPQLAARGSGGGGDQEEEEEEEDVELSGGLPRANASQWRKLKELLWSFFPSCDVDYPDVACSALAQLSEAIQTQLKERHLQHLPSQVEKVGQHHSLLSSQPPIILLDQATPSQPPALQLCPTDRTLWQRQDHLPQDLGCRLPADQGGAGSGYD